MDKNQKRQGVTLIELAVTILIVALIITAIGVVMAGCLPQNPRRSRQ